ESILNGLKLRMRADELQQVVDAVDFVRGFGSKGIGVKFDLKSPRVIDDAADAYMLWIAEVVAGKAGEEVEESMGGLDATLLEAEKEAISKLAALTELRALHKPDKERFAIREGYYTDWVYRDDPERWA